MSGRSDSLLSPAHSLMLTMYDGSEPSPVLPVDTGTADSMGTPCTGPWGEGETRLLLTLYGQYSTKVGPMKKFRSKRAMYEHISKEILQILGICRTATQCESRFKTIAKRTKTEDTNNKTSGHTRCQVSYEEEFAQIRAADDSIEPEVLRGVHSVTYKSAPKPIEEASTSTRATAFSESTDHSSSETLDDSTSEPAEKAGHEQRKRKKTDETDRPSAGRMRHMEYFFERMEKINKEREAKKDEREKRREERHLELIKLHREHIDALKDMAAKTDT